MTISGDHLESRSQWSKMRSDLTLVLIIVFFGLLLWDPRSRGYALVGLALIATIMLHETGHFIAAKWAGMKADEFFVGFGPRIWSFKKGETEYGIKAIPLGGYVRIIGMTNLDEIDPADEVRTYRQAKTYKKLIVILAGITMNIFLAFVLFYIFVFGGQYARDPNTSPVKIASVVQSSTATTLHLHKGDRIVSIDHQAIPTFNKLVSTLGHYKTGDKVTVGYERNGTVHTATTNFRVRPDADKADRSNATLGISVQGSYYHTSALSSIPLTGRVMYRETSATIASIGKIFSFSGLSHYSKTVVHGDYKDPERPSSVEGIINIGGKFVNQDTWILFDLMGLINILLALFNLLPVIPLDGGHAAIAIYEWFASVIMRRKVVLDIKKLFPVAAVAVGLIVILSLSTLWLDLLQTFK